MYESFLNGDFVVRRSSRKGSVAPVDQAVEKAYSNPAKSSSGIIDFIQRKEAVCKWNVIRHGKAKYPNFMITICQMDENDECSLHYEFSDWIPKANRSSIATLMINVL